MKAMNAYARATGDLYTKTPKAVWSALAVSFARIANGEGELDDNDGALRLALMREWDTLHACGIVPQPAPRELERGAA